MMSNVMKPSMRCGLRPVLRLRRHTPALRCRGGAGLRHYCRVGLRSRRGASPRGRSENTACRAKRSGSRARTRCRDDRGRCCGRGERLDRGLGRAGGDRGAGAQQDRDSQAGCCSDNHVNASRVASDDVGSRFASFANRLLQLVQNRGQLWRGVIMCCPAWRVQGLSRSGRRYRSAGSSQPLNCAARFSAKAARDSIKSLLAPCSCRRSASCRCGPLGSGRIRRIM